MQKVIYLLLFPLSCRLLQEILIRLRQIIIKLQTHQATGYQVSGIIRPRDNRDYVWPLVLRAYVPDIRVGVVCVRIRAFLGFLKVFVRLPFIAKLTELKEVDEALVLRINKLEKSPDFSLQ